jgi:hypothetical protein
LLLSDLPFLDSIEVTTPERIDATFRHVTIALRDPSRRHVAMIVLSRVLVTDDFRSDLVVERKTLIDRELDRLMMADHIDNELLISYRRTKMMMSR